ncbi:endoglin-like isoform X2 [Brienomyrus brachyistius]|nr:endoglin-like isoform X2 [Brienomyrus brachyistius]
METPVVAAAILILAFATMATSEYPRTCEPLEKTDKGLWRGEAQNISTACQSNYSSNSYEVHILHLVFTVTDSNSSNMLLDLTAMKPSHLIVSSNARISIYVNALENKDRLSIMTNDQVSTEGHVSVMMNLPSNAEDLLKYITGLFKGVTSSTSIKDPKSISFSGGEASGTTQPPTEQATADLSICKQLERMTFQMNLYTSPDHTAPVDVATRVQIGKLLYAEISSSITLGEIILHFKVTSCSVSSSTDHSMVWDLPFIEVPCPPQACRHSTRLSLSFMEPRELTAASWALECSLMVWTTESDPCAHTTSVKRNIELTPPSSHPADIGPSQPPPDNQKDQVPLKMQLFISPDFRDPIDQMTRIPRDSPIYAEISSTTLGGIVLQFKVTSCSATSGFDLGPVWDLPFTEVPCSPQACRHSTRLRLSLMELPEPTAASWALECSAQMCANMDDFTSGCVNVGSVRKHLMVTTYLFPTSLPFTADSQAHVFRERKDIGPSQPPPDNQKDQVPLLMQLFTSPDFSDPIDLMTRVPSDKPLYAEVAYRTLGDINMSLYLQVTACIVTSRSSCDASLSLPFTTEHCPPKVCPHSVRLSFSLLPLRQLRPTSWLLECPVQMCIPEINYQCIDVGSVKRNLEITRASLSPARQCVDFGPSAVLGVAFGGFLTGVVFVGILWFIRVRTG